MMARRLWLASLLVTLGVGCSGPSDVVTQVPTGRWGGDHVEMVVASASVQLEFDCAHGSIPSSIPVRDGLFDVPGVFVLEHGGPVVVGEVLPEYQAHYRGTTDGEHMTLAIEADGLGNVGSFALDLGRTGRVVKCQ